MEEKMQIEKLIQKFYLGSLTSKELSVLLDDLKDMYPKHEILSFYQYKWDEATEFNGNIDSSGIYDQVVSRIGISGRELLPTKESPIKVVGYFRRFWQYAAVFVFAFGLSWLINVYIQDRTKIAPISGREQIHMMEVPYGSKSRIFLPDGSVVNLNSGSSLKYTSSAFNSGSRSVSLTGEGFFTVVKNPARPFYVNASGIKVKVLGTTFNIKAYPDENFVETLLVKGKIEIFASSDKKEKGKPIILTPNQRALFLKSENEFIPNFKDKVRAGVAVTPVKLKTINLQSPSKTEQAISWKDNKLIFDNESFSSLVIRIERWYNVRIVVNYPELYSARFTGKFDKETLEQVMIALVSVTPFKYNIKKDLVTISKN
jgi:transmembrane sensor